MKRDSITVKYNAKPNVPNKTCHKFPINELTIVRSNRFKLNEIDKAWKFILECTSPITKLKQILFASPNGRLILDAMEDGLLNETGNWMDIKEIQDSKMVDLKYALNLS